MPCDVQSKLEIYFKDCERRGCKFRVGSNLYLALNRYSCTLFVWSSARSCWTNIGRMQYKDVRFWGEYCRIGSNLFHEGFLAKFG